MRLAAAFSLFQDLWQAVPAGIMPTVRAVLLSPSLLLRPREFLRLFFAQMWIPFGNGVNENSRAVKEVLITPNAYGVVLDIGAGYTAFYNCYSPYSFRIIKI
jgi:hypothetical protein